MTTPREIADYLSTLPTVHNLRACTVTIASVAYPAAYYRDTLTTAENSPAWLRGEREHTREMIYVAGMLPKRYLRSSHCAFTRADDSREWYVAGYFGSIKARTQAVHAPNKFHPFGNSFLLAPWDAAEPIDRYARNPYQRVTMTVTEES